jgi:hypothetical protein
MGSLRVTLLPCPRRKVSRRSRGEDAIYFATAKNRYVGSVSLGYGPDGKRIRRKVFGQTKQEVRKKLKALHQEMNAAVRSRKAGLGEDWVPREMRHTFVSVLSANDVPVESIALLAGHDRTATTESVYRHEIRPALTRGAEVLDKIFASGASLRRPLQDRAWCLGCSLSRLRRSYAAYGLVAPARVARAIDVVTIA